jgi:GDP-L-fucose synthase
MMAVAEHGARSKAYNLGTSGETKIAIEDLAQMIQLLTNHHGLIKFDTDAPTGDQVRCTDSSKAHELGWKHKVNLEEGLRRTIEWWNEQGH